MNRWLGLACFFGGVLLGGCGTHLAGAERTPSGSNVGPAPARVGAHIPSRSGLESLRYAVRLDAELERIDVEACPMGFAISRLTAPSPGAQALLEAGKIVTPEGDYPCPDEELDLPLLRPDECLRYAVILPKTWHDPSAFRRAQGDLLASPDVWLWVPTPRPVGLHMRAHFSLPEGVAAALPWPRSGSDFEIPETAFAWKSGGGFTHSALRELAVPRAELELATLGEGLVEHESDVRDWLSQGARASSLLFGGFPVLRALVLTVPGERAGPAFGMALRGGGPAVVIFFDRRASAATLADDWTSTHEFLHLGVPRLPPEDAWLFEGLATYYTEVARARAGLITPERAYQHLLDGFERGRRQGSALSLRSESARMRARRSFFRVYWAGAALVLLTDVASRRAHGPTLDSALRSFAECCAASQDDWTAERVLIRLDRSLGAPRFSEQARRWLDSSEFPELAATWRALGVSAGQNGEARFSDAADSALRDAIMARSP